MCGTPREIRDSLQRLRELPFVTARSNAASSGCRMVRAYSSSTSLKLVFPVTLAVIFVLLYLLVACWMTNERFEFVRPVVADTYRRASKASKALWFKREKVARSRERRCIDSTTEAEAAVLNVAVP